MYLQIRLITFTNNRSTSPFSFDFFFSSLSPLSSHWHHEAGVVHLNRSHSCSMASSHSIKVVVGTVHDNIESIHIPVQYQINSNHIKALSLKLSRSKYSTVNSKPLIGLQGEVRGFVERISEFHHTLFAVHHGDRSLARRRPYGAAGSEVRTTQTLLTSNCQCLNISQKISKPKAKTKTKTATTTTTTPSPLHITPNPK